MNNIKVLGKFLDQPVLVSKFKKAVPVLLTGGAAVYTANDALKEEKGKRKERALKTGITLGTTVAAALAAPHIASAITKRPLPANLNTVKTKNKELVDSFINTNEIEKPIKDILNKSKEKILSFKEVKTLYTNLKEKPNGKEFLEKLIPSPENIKAKDIFSEIGYLSIHGAVPVAGGIIGGISADRITDKKHWKEKVPNKIKEGSYQYLANIFMCNIGAGAALALLEKANITSKSARAAGMTIGIITTGVIGGSKIANFIGKKVIDPIFGKKGKEKNEDILDISFSDEKLKKYLFNTKTETKEKERTPELLDLGLHTDDIATVSLLSGLKWIEPALPVLYTISGYRAGTGYRN